jgi:autotransporter translocation and assembly factor TamB
VRSRLQRLAAIVTALVLVAALTIGLQGPRSLAVRIALQVALATRGLHLDVHAMDVGADQTTIDDLVITDKSGARVFSAQHITVTYERGGPFGGTDRAYGLSRVAAIQPMLYLTRYDDGTFNISQLFSSGPAAGQTPAQNGPPLRAVVEISDGSLVFTDPTSVDPRGRKFSVEDINATADIDKGGMTRGDLTALFNDFKSAGPAHMTRISGKLVEDDRSQYALASLAAPDLDFVPIVDGFVSSRSFAMHAGTADVQLRAFDAGFDPAAGPQWRLNGEGALHDARLTVVPLDVPLRDVSGRMHFDGGRLSFTRTSGTAAGIPVTIDGGLRLIGGVTLSIGASFEADAARVRRLFRVANQLPLHGDVAAQVFITGAPSDVHARAALRAPDSVSYQDIALADFAGDLYYANGHVTLTSIDGFYDDGTVHGGGDVAVAQDGSPALFALVGRVPAAGLPFVANLNPGGESAAIASFNGPFARLSGEGYAQVTGGDGVGIRAVAQAGPARFSAGAIVKSVDGGELTLEAGIDRPLNAPRTIEGVALAHAIDLDLREGSYALPGVGGSIALPSIAATLDGAAWLQGPEAAPRLGIDLLANGLVVAGYRLGEGRAIATGSAGSIRVARLSFDGPDGSLASSGFASASPSAGTYALALHGSGSTDIASLPGLSPNLRARGRSDATFDGVMSGGRWTMSGDANSANATIAGIPVHNLDATMSGGGGLPTQVFAATASAAGGAIAATGTVPHGGASADTLAVWADALDMRQLHSLGVPLSAGSATAFAQIGGSMNALRASAQAAVSGGRYQSVPISGDVDMQYGGGTLTARAGRVAYAGNRVEVNGSIADLAGGAPLASDPLDVHARMRVGDLGGLLNSYLPRAAILTGVVGGAMRLRGTLGAPSLDGVIYSDGGTVRGVAFKNFHGDVRLERGMLALQNGHVQFGSSLITLAGEVSPSDIHVRSTSPHVDLSDFNDFFDGYDTLDGVGSWNVAFTSSPATVAANGRIDFSGAALAGYPLGVVDATFASSKNELLATLRQRGPADNAQLAGSASFASRRSGLPDLTDAQFDVHGGATGVDLGIVMPLIRHEDIGLTGSLDIAGQLRGKLAHPSAIATFALRDGHLGKLEINALSGSLESDGKSFGLTDAHVQLPFAQAAGSAQFGPGDRIVGSAGLDAQDLGKVATAFGRPGIVEGAAKMSLNVGGTYRKPRVQAMIAGGAGSLLGVRYDSVNANVDFQPGELDVSDARLAFASNRGALTLAGTLPLQLKPLALGPKNRPLNLRLTADHVDLAAFDPLTNRYATMTGTLQATASATGLAGNPVLGGSATLRGASVHSPFETVPLNDVAADLTLAQDTVTLSRFRGSLGSGDVVAKASAHVVPAVGLRSNPGFQYSGTIAFNSANVDVPDWISGTLNGNFSLTKSGVNPFLDGTITASDALVPFSAIYTLATAFGQGSAPSAPGPVPGVPSPLPGRTVAYAGSIYGGGFHLVSSEAPATPKPSILSLPTMHLNVTAAAGKRVRIKGGAMDLTAAGKLTIGGQLSAPKLDGAFSSTRGQVTYFDTVFRIDSGTVTFDSSQGLLPSLDVRATTNTGGSQITLAISGRVDRLNTDMSSNPSMSRDEIAATLLHASVVTGLTSSPSQAQAVLTGEAQAYFNAQLTRSLLFPLESYLAETLDIEQINFIFDQNGQPAVEIRKLFTPTIYGIYRSTVKLPVTQSFGVAYLLRDTTSLEFLQTQSPEGVSTATIDLSFTFR